MGDVSESVMGAGRRLYFDNAATSFPKPPSVHAAMARYATELGASPGRGSYRESVDGAALIWQCRERLCRLLGGTSPEHVVFTLNTSDALNLAIRGLTLDRLMRGEPTHVVTTAMDHNSVLRPLNALRRFGLEWTCVEVDPATGLVDPDDVLAAVRDDTVMVAAVHASNVTGTVQPIGEIGRRCRERGVLVLVDAAQSVGHVPVDVASMCIDLLAFPGHKGLLGPLGTGGLYIRPGLEEMIEPVREGGTGSVSESDEHPATMPDRYEPGSHNTIGLVGLSEGVRWILGRGIDEIRAHEESLMRVMMDRLPGEEAGLRVLGPASIEDRVGVFSVVHESLDAATLAAALESHAGVLVRAGLHCAPRAHGTFGTLAAGGACRLSLGPFLTAADCELACGALDEICRSAAAV